MIAFESETPAIAARSWIAIWTQSSVPPLKFTGVLDTDARMPMKADGAAKNKSIDVGEPVTRVPVPTSKGLPDTPASARRAMKHLSFVAGFEGRIRAGAWNPFTLEHP